MDELVKRLRDAAISADSGNEISESLYRDILQAADAIEELLSERDEVNANSWKTALEVECDEHRWIPVTERLPEPFKNILAANKRGKHYDIDKGWWNGTFFDRCAKGGYHNVTHWMPLPEPPKEE